MSLDTFTGGYVSDALAVGLFITLLFSNLNRTTGKKDTKYLYGMLVVVLCAASFDFIVYYLDGIPGIFNTFLLYILNSYLYVASALALILWICYVSAHLNIKLHRGHLICLNIFLGLGILLLVINLFTPIVFSVNNNIYKREPFYAVYFFFPAICMLDSILIYLKAKKEGGLLKFFPISLFIAPMCVGIAISFFIYGINIVWAAGAISIAAIMNASNNESIFLDKLTGIYNRSYLDHLKQDIYKGKNAFITGIMIDLNGFKAINDKLGHAMGDDALITAAKIFADVVGEKGNVIRYAGDEFVILLNTIDEGKVKDIILQIRKALEEMNIWEEKPYTLSASMGYATLDIKNQSMTDFMNIIDENMYEDKKRFYTEHTEMERRRSR